MKVESLPYRVEPLTWQFVDMGHVSGHMALMWDWTMGSVAFQTAQN